MPSEKTQSAPDRQRALALLQQLRTPPPPIEPVPGPTDIDPPSVPGHPDIQGWTRFNLEGLAHRLGHYDTSSAVDGLPTLGIGG